jgi:opacity protein-like surface antigen
MMKKLAFVAVFVISFSMIAVAQDIPAYQFFAGYSMLQNQNIDHFTGQRTGASLNGWDLSVALNGKRSLAAVIDLSGHYGMVSNQNSVENFYTPKPDHNFKSHSLMFGPKVSFHAGKLTPFVQSLYGIVHTNLGGRSLVRMADTVGIFGGRTPNYQRIGNRITTNNFGMTAGGGLDVAINEKFGVRLIQAEYNMVRSGGFLRNNVKFSTGFTYNSGRRY